MMHVSVQQRAEEYAEQTSDRARDDSKLFQRQMEQGLDPFDKKQNGDHARGGHNCAGETGLRFSGHLVPLL
jgi:hypothetical protein